jgi:hypothetical protein
MEMIRKPMPNSTYKKLEVQLLNEVQFFNQTIVQIESEVLRNHQLLIAQPGFSMKNEDLFVVKKGTNHRVSSKAECLIMLIEPKTTEHTGKVKSAISKSIEEQIY